MTLTRCTAGASTNRYLQIRVNVDQNEEEQLGCQSQGTAYAYAQLDEVSQNSLIFVSRHDTSAGVVM